MRKIIFLLKVATFSLCFVAVSNQTKAQTDSITIPAKSIAEPTIYVGNTENSDDGMSKEVILENSFLTAKDPNNYVEWEILSYRVTFVSNGKEEAPITVTGEQFTEQIKSRIQSASSGTIIEFTDIRIQSIAGGTRLIVRPIVVRIR